jgi:hypothetical protein
MCGSDTFAMLVSSSSMNVAIVTVIAINQGLMAGAETSGGTDVAGESAVAGAMAKRDRSVSRQPCYHESDQSVSYGH